MNKLSGKWWNKNTYIYLSKSHPVEQWNGRPYQQVIVVAIKEHEHVICNQEAWLFTSKVVFDDVMLVVWVDVGIAAADATAAAVVVVVVVVVLLVG